ncbi:MAG: alpha/beta fold hydrolase [Pirellulales bacterium]
MAPSMASWRDLYPFQSHKFAPRPPVGFPIDAAPKLHYVDEGRTAANSDGSPILCVHGNPTWSFYYREIALQLRGERRVLAVDNMGCGLSDKPQVYSYSLDTHIDNLLQLIRHLDLQRITLVVHDWGGAIGLGAAVSEPERFQQLIILNTAAFPPPYFPLRIRACRFPVLGNWAMRSLNLFARAALHMTINRLKKLSPSVAAGLIAPYDNWEHRVAIARFVQDIPTRPDQPTWQRLTQIEQGLSALRDRPARIVWGMRDWCFRPECCDRFEKLLPQAKIERLDDVGHYVMEEAASEVVAAIRDCANETSRRDVP